MFSLTESCGAPAGHGIYLAPSARDARASGGRRRKQRSNGAELLRHQGGYAKPAMRASPKQRGAENKDWPSFATCLPNLMQSGGQRQSNVRSRRGGSMASPRSVSTDALRGYAAPAEGTRTQTPTCTAHAAPGTLVELVNVSAAAGLCGWCRSLPKPVSRGSSRRRGAPAGYACPQLGSPHPTTGRKPGSAQPTTPKVHRKSTPACHLSAEPRRRTMDQYEGCPRRASAPRRPPSCRPRGLRPPSGARSDDEAPRAEGARQLLLP